MCRRVFRFVGLTPHTHTHTRQEDGRERYVFFSFPHIAINDGGELSAITRPNRPGTSCACGALAKVGALRFGGAAWPAPAP